MKSRSLPKSAVEKTPKASPAPKSAVQRQSKKAAADISTSAATATTTGSGNGPNGLNGQHDPVIASLDENVSVTSSPQEDQIAARAYQIWLENGQPEGRDEENWQQALRELSSNTAPVG